MTRQTLFAVALVTGLAAAAPGAELYTPPSQAQDGSVIRCTMTNLSTNPITVGATIVDGNGNDITISSNCYGPPAVLAPGHLCFADTAIPGLKSGYCHFSASTSKVRAALLIVGSGGAITNGFVATK